jgi:hypothetical protein
MKPAVLVSCVASLFLVPGAHAQVPVIDAANLSQSQQTATNTKQILSTDQNILSNVQKTLQAVTGDRSSLAQGSLSQMALGGGFSMSNAPSLGSVVSGGPLSFAGLGGNSQQIISSLINGLNLVKTLSGLQSGLPSDKAYLNSSGVDQTGCTYVQGAFQELARDVMAGGAGASIASLLLIAWVIFWGFGIWSGTATGTATDAAFRLLRAFVIYALATSWSDFTSFAYTLFNDGPAAIGNRLLSVGNNNTYTSPNAVVSALESIWNQVAQGFQLHFAFSPAILCLGPRRARLRHHHRAISRGRHGKIPRSRSPGSSPP